MIPLLVQVLHEKKQIKLIFSPEEIYLNFQDKYRLKNQLGKHHISKRQLKKDRHGIIVLIQFIKCFALHVSNSGLFSSITYISPEPHRVITEYRCRGKSIPGVAQNQIQTTKKKPPLLYVY